MAFNMTIWENREGKLAELPKTKLDSEERLETWIEQDSSILGLDVLIIGKQVRTPYGGRIDLLAIDDQGDLVLIELKRDRTPREVVAQVLDYASWVHQLTQEEILDLALTYLKSNLADAFTKRFGFPLPESLNQSHRMVIVASELDDSSERIVQYLSSVYALKINAVFFSCFIHDGKELVGRSWLMDPEEEDPMEKQEARRSIPIEVFYKDLSHQCGKEAKGVADKIAQWVEREKLEPSAMKGSRLSSFIPILFYREETWYPISVQTTGRVVLQMQWLRSKPPFNAREKQLEVMKKLNEIPGVSIPEDRIEGRPSIPLSRLVNQPALDQFLSVLSWVVAQIRAS